MKQPKPLSLFHPRQTILPSCSAATVILLILPSHSVLPTDCLGPPTRNCFLRKIQHVCRELTLPVHSLYSKSRNESMKNLLLIHFSWSTRCPFSAAGAFCSTSKAACPCTTPLTECQSPVKVMRKVDIMNRLNPTNFLPFFFFEN